MVLEKTLERSLDCKVTTKNKICGRDEEEGEGELTERRSGEKGEVRGKEERRRGREKREIDGVRVRARQRQREEEGRKRQQRAKREKDRGQGGKGDGRGLPGCRLRQAPS